jgi:hypothetical protein
VKLEGGLGMLKPLQWFLPFTVHAVTTASRFFQCHGIAIFTPSVPACISITDEHKLETQE